jgi:hypothetical protein
VALSIIIIIIIIIIAVISMVIIIIIIIIIFSSFVQGIYTYIPETNHVPMEYIIIIIIYRTPTMSKHSRDVLRCSLDKVKTPDYIWLRCWLCFHMKTVLNISLL